MGVQTQTQSEQDDHHDDDSYCTYEEILSEEELVRLQNEFQPRLKSKCLIHPSLFLPPALSLS